MKRMLPVDELARDERFHHMSVEEVILDPRNASPKARITSQWARMLASDKTAVHVAVTINSRGWANTCKAVANCSSVLITIRRMRSGTNFRPVSLSSSQ